MITEPLPEDKFTFEHTYVAFDADNVMLEVGNVEKIYNYKSVTKPIAAWGILVAIAKGSSSWIRPRDPRDRRSGTSFPTRPGCRRRRAIRSRSPVVGGSTQITVSM